MNRQLTDTGGLVQTLCFRSGDLESLCNGYLSFHFPFLDQTHVYYTIIFYKLWLRLFLDHQFYSLFLAFFLPPLYFQFLSTSTAFPILFCSQVLWYNELKSVEYVSLSGLIIETSQVLFSLSFFICISGYSYSGRPGKPYVKDGRVYVNLAPEWPHGIVPHAVQEEQPYWFTVLIRTQF